MAYEIIISLFLVVLGLFSCFFTPKYKYKVGSQYCRGLTGPKPWFLLGNLKEMKAIKERSMQVQPCSPHHLEPLFFPYFVEWKKSYGKKFVYWLGTEPVLYIEEPKLISEIASTGSFNWGRPTFLKNDRHPLFGNGLIMAEGISWLHQRRVVTQALTSQRLKDMFDTVVKATNSVLEEWDDKFKNAKGCHVEVDVEEYLNKITTQVISTFLFGEDYLKGFEILDKLKQLQCNLFSSPRYVGVPGSTYIPSKANRRITKLGKEASLLIKGIIKDRVEPNGRSKLGDDFLGFLLEEVLSKRTLNITMEDVVDECKTFLLAGQETTKLSLTWTLMLLASSPEWQERVRNEIFQVTEDLNKYNTEQQQKIVDMEGLSRLKVMSMVLNESMRLYPPVSYTVRQAKQDMEVCGLVVPKGMSVLINIVGVHGDPRIWGDEGVHDFKPERFERDNTLINKREQGFIPFGFGGRICAGEKLAKMEQKTVLSLLLSRFGFSLSPNYVHSPTTLLSIMPSNGLPLILHRTAPPSPRT